MPTFFDERGDTGKVGTTNSSLFQVAGVCFPTADSVREFDKSIKELRTSLGLKSDFEFKFAKAWNHQDRTEAFFRTAMNFPFNFAFYSLDKSAEEHKRLTGLEIWSICVKKLASSLEPVYRERYAAAGKKRLMEKLILDDTRDREQLHLFNNHFRQIVVGDAPLRHLSASAHFSDSRKDTGIQLADMIVGATGIAIEGNMLWYDLIRDRDVSIE